MCLSVADSGGSSKYSTPESATVELPVAIVEMVFLTKQNDCERESHHVKRDQSPRMDRAAFRMSPVVILHLG